MKMSKLFGRTLRDDPGEAELISHRLLLQAGMIHQVSSGVYSYLPLAWRSLRKIEQIIREEMEYSGAQEIKLGILQPRELWKQSGRDEVFGPDMMRMIDRRERDLVLPPTNEELITETVKSVIQSYRDMPVTLFQIQTKFRDELRPRGGLVRVREFDMMDAYSFDVNQEGLDESYELMVKAYENAFKRCGIKTVIAEADSGPIGGKDSKEFILLTESGEDTVVMCNQCQYAANDEKASLRKIPNPETPQADMEQIHTPGVKTIDQLASLLEIGTEQTLKAVFYSADGELVFATIRGDLEVNDVKLKNSLGVSDLKLASAEEVKAGGLVAGSASPIGLENIKIIVDDSVRLGSNFVAGGNREDYHVKNVNYPRDFQSHIEADIALAEAGHGCPKCDGVLQTQRGIEIGHVFKLGTSYSESMDANYSDVSGELNRIVMGCYGIGVGRVLAGAIEQLSDNKGIVFPQNIAPYKVIIIGLNTDKSEVVTVAEDLHEKLNNIGIETLYYDRQETAGVKFNDADLIGIPLRIVVSNRNLSTESLEIKIRTESEGRMIALENACDEIKGILETIN